MRRHIIFGATVLANLGHCGPTPLVAHVVRDTPSDPDDLSFIKSIASIGDSYAAGIGAGSRLGKPWDLGTFGDWKCSRYDSSYPALMNGLLFGNKTDQFQFHACSGALVQEVIDEQVGLLHDDQDVITLSAGGNDAELVWILNHCVFQFFSPTPEASKLIETGLKDAVEIAPEILIWWELNKGKFERSCDQQLKRSEEIINSHEFTDRIGALVDRSKAKLRKDSGAIYYTGYAKFFDADIENNDYCSQKENSWSFIYNVEDPTKIISDRAVLTKERRQKMNSLVELVNKKIRDTVKAKASKNSKGQEDVIFVDYDGYFGDVEGRFCTKGVRMSEKDRSDDLTFYPLNLWDPLGSSDFKRDDAVDVFNGTFESDIDIMAKLADMSGAHYRSDVTVIKAKAKAKALAFEADADDKSVNTKADGHANLEKRMSILPDGYGRVFHPTIAGHGIMAKLVLWKMAQRNAQGLKVDYVDEVGPISENNACPLLDNTPELSAKCTGSDRAASALPARVFWNSSGNKGVFDEFCDQMDHDKLDDQIPHIWTVNARGERQGQSNTKRAPPVDPKNYKQMIKLQWTPNRKNRNCRASCHDAFSRIAQSPCGSNGGTQDIMAVKTKYNIGCGTFAYEITGEGVPKPDPAYCINSKIQAPKYDSNRDSGTGKSIETAYKQFCRDNNGKSLDQLPKVDMRSQRYPITVWGIENRMSFWVRAKIIPGCEGTARISEYDCNKKLGDGLGFCKDNSGLSAGYVAQSECIEYAVETSYSTRDDWPPWNPGAIAPSFPPAEDLDSVKPICFKTDGTERSVSDTDLNKAIDAFCSDPKITGFQKMAMYPHKSMPPFYPNDGLIYYLAMAATNVDLGDPKPYRDMNWCKNFDFKHLNKDDCTYAMRKLVHECTNSKGKYPGGQYTYRCQHYKYLPINYNRQAGNTDFGPDGIHMTH